MGVEPEEFPKPGSPKGDQQRVQWRQEVLPKVKEVLSGFRSTGVYHPTIRAVYYKLFSMGAIPENSFRMYKGLVRMLTDVRMEGTDDLVRPDTFSDESRSSPEEEIILTAENWAEYQTRKLKKLLNGDTEFVPHPWQNQPYYVEVWIEKQAMYSTFEAILEYRMVAIQSSKGFNSLSTLFTAYERLKAIQEAYPDRRIVILYFGDLDPSGDSMDDDIQTRLDHFSRIWSKLHYKFVRVGVKPEHVREYNLPEDPDAATAKRLKDNDPRYRGFMRKYGKLYAVELDALAGQEPEAFRQLVLDAVDKYYDHDIWQQVKEEETPDKAAEELKKRIKEEIVPLVVKTTKKGKKDKKESK
jgi:hypothetical protein